MVSQTVLRELFAELPKVLVAHDELSITNDTGKREWGILGNFYFCPVHGVFYAGHGLRFPGRVCKSCIGKSQVMGRECPFFLGEGELWTCAGLP